MKRKSTILLIAVGMWCSATAQVELSRQVVGCFGGYTSLGPYESLTFTGGESVISTLTSSDYILTQGFHQPLTPGALRFVLEVTAVSCPTSSDGWARVTALQGCAPPYEVTWSNGVSGEVNGRLTVGFHTVTVTSATCEVSESFEIFADPEGNCRIRFFNAFSPNGDGVNDVWEIENIDLPEFTPNRVEVFNRWGDVVWQGDGYNNSSVRWDGNGPNGRPLPNGTYYFVARVAGVLHKGYIELTK